MKTAIPCVSFYLIVGLILGEPGVSAVPAVAQEMLLRTLAPSTPSSALNDSGEYGARYQLELSLTMI